MNVKLLGACRVLERADEKSVNKHIDPSRYLRAHRLGRRRSCGGDSRFKCHPSSLSSDVAALEPQSCLQGFASWLQNVNPHLSSRRRGHLEAARACSHACTLLLANR